ncbi:hypothetical protein L1049_014790 [Liquidambar formosana]|uniref:Ankyrin repeat-containing protein BDA1-like n=1 Tax=Liquidambar formosana TaxID=63359 RepID=A0AAP0RXR7_LIQFO
MRMAAARGNIEIVREILTLGPDLCIVKDKGGRISLHYAAMKGKDHVVEELLSQCPKAIEVLTARGETAFHLAVKNKQFEAFRVLVERLENMDNRYWKLINAKNEEGNTILELAISTNQHQVLDLLHGKGDLLGLEQVNAAAELETNLLLENQTGFLSSIFLILCSRAGIKAQLILLIQVSGELLCWVPCSVCSALLAGVLEFSEFFVKLGVFLCFVGFSELFVSFKCSLSMGFGLFF